MEGFAAITDKIERAAEWASVNGPLQEDEQATMRRMIECQMARYGAGL